VFHIIPTINGNYLPNSVNWFGFVMETVCLECSSNADKLSPVLNYAPYSEEILGVWFHVFSTTARERALVTHWVWCWVIPELSKQQKNLCSHQESNP